MKLLLSILVILFFFAESLPNLSLIKHPLTVAQAYLSHLSRINTEFNHEHAFSICANIEAVPAQYVGNHRRIKIGSGLRDFDKAEHILLNFTMINADSLLWANVITLPENQNREVRVGDIIGTHVNCYKLFWSLNPCKVTYVGKYADHERKRASQIAFSTVYGHLLEGEERFRVELDFNGDVFFDMFSYSRGHQLLGALAFPFIKPLQRSFFSAVETSFLNQMKREANPKADLQQHDL